MHGAIANQAPLTSAASLQPALKKGAGARAQQAGGSSTAQKNASEEAERAGYVKPNGLYFSLKASVGRKSSDDTEEESNPGDSSPLSAEGDNSATTAEADSLSSPEDVGLPTTLGQLYTARGALSGAPSVAGGIFETTV